MLDRQLGCTTAGGDGDFKLVLLFFVTQLSCDLTESSGLQHLSFSLIVLSSVAVLTEEALPFLDSILRGEGVTTLSEEDVIL